MFLTLLLAVLVGCQTGLNIEVETNETTEISPLIITESMYAVIGEQIPNPLSLEIVKEAFTRLSPETKGDITLDDIQATHKYIAFTPANEDELYAVMDINEEDIILFSYPQDYVISDGIVVPDERFRTNGFSYRWAYVPIDFDLSQVGCPYVHYYDICSLRESDVTKSGRVVTTELLDALERETYALCGRDLVATPQTKGSNVTPYGRIRFYDDYFYEYRGVNGLSIRTVRGTHSSYTHCNNDGTFVSADSFKYAFNYEIHFSRTDFVIWLGTSTDEITYVFHSYTGPLYMDYYDFAARFHATISKAAIVYYYGDNCGLRRPPMKNDNGTARLGIHARTDDGGNVLGNFGVDERWILNDRPVLNIYCRANTVLLSNVEMYATTMHELAHASHWRNNQATFNATERRVTESFARGVQWLLTSSAYPGYSCASQYFRNSYTGIVQDLYDGYGYKTSPTYADWYYVLVDGEYVFMLIGNNIEKTYYDCVSGFTAAQIEVAVRNSTTWNQWESNLINYYPNIANGTDVATSFDYWIAVQ